MELKDVITKARERVGMNQLELGQACGWGGAQGRIGNYENGIRQPKLADLIRIAKACQTTAAEMVAQVEGVDLRQKFGALLSTETDTYVVSKRAALVARGYDDLNNYTRELIDRILEDRLSTTEARTHENNPEPTKNEKARRSSRRTVQDSKSQR